MKNFIKSVHFMIGTSLTLLGIFGFFIPNDPAYYHSCFTTPYSIAEIIIGLIMLWYLFDREFEIEELKKRIPE